MRECGAAFAVEEFVACVEEVVAGRSTGVMKLALCIATMQPRPNGMLPGEASSWTALAKDVQLYLRAYVWANTAEKNLGVVASYQKLYEGVLSTGEDILAYVHDDVICREQGWDQRVLKEFEDPSIGIVGFGGATQHGHANLYKVPYQLQQLARADYYSNVDDAEIHGTRFEGSKEVAVLDGFALVVRRGLLDRAGGWPAKHIRFHCYDYAICAYAHRFGYRVRVVGVRCHHLGGRTSTTKEYQEWAKGNGMTDGEDHTRSHKWIYEEFRDVLPWTARNQ